MPLVDGEGYLDAVDKTASGTVVVVFIYNSDVRIHFTTHPILQQVTNDFYSQGPSYHKRLRASCTM
jgi:hypothetical protein